MANILAKLLNFLLAIYYIGLGAGALYDLRAILEAAGAPLDDKSKFAPYGMASFFHTSRLMGMISIGLGLMLLVYGGSRVAFFFSALASASCAFEEHMFKEQLAGLGASEKHLEGVNKAFIAFAAAAGVAALGLLVAGGSSKKAKTE